MENGVDRSAGRAEAPRRAGAKDSLGAIALAEGAIAERIYWALGTTTPIAERSVFGEPVMVERTAAHAGVARFVEAAEGGKRATLVAFAHDLAAARDALRALAARRVGTVAHVVAARGAAHALALADLGWGMLFAAGVEEALDLALVARRAAEDCGTPFFVVHERGPVRHVEAVAPPSRELVDVFVGAPSGRTRAPHEPQEGAHAGAGERAFAERVPFALGSALRELESLTGRRRDVLERVPAGDASVMIVAMGELGESVISGVERLRAAGHDVGAIKLTAFRPFPGPRLVKGMARALALTVLEPTDEPLAQSGPLTREVKAAFADAITWAPDYPGIGRVPRIASGYVAGALEAPDLDAILHNMIADERGRRSFVVGGEPSLPPSDLAAGAGLTASPVGVSMRGRVRDASTAEACADLCAAIVSSALGLHVRVSVRSAPASEGEGVAFDLLASRERPRGVQAPHAVKLVVLEDLAALTTGNPLARLAEGGVLAVPTRERSADAVWGEIPAYAKAIVFDRRASVVGWEPEGDAQSRPWLTAAAFAGLALACGGGAGARAPVDGSLVAREVAEALRTLIGPVGEAVAMRGAEVARRVFEARVEVPRATVERDEESVRLGRRDARTSQAPR
jgi:pyruvate/2-oxoacid:ferredoxin oxidoreductase alpha subunit